MKLHEFTTEFKDLISVVAAYKHLPESAVERDYYIVLMLQKLADSEYSEKCVFKGGTSLSKCYPGSGCKISDKKQKDIADAQDLLIRITKKNMNVF